jgi:penicillin-binding protein activator
MKRGFPKVLMTAAIVSSCSPAFEGEYSDPAKAEIVDDRWNETDARQTAEVLIKSALSKPWLKEFTKGNKTRPIVIVDEVENRTDEHLDTKALTEYIRNELLNSGEIRFANNERRAKILDEIKYQQSGAVAKDQAKSLGKQVGANFLLGGAMSSSVHSMDELKTVTYQTNLTLTNLETAEIEWSEKHLVKKRFKRKGAGW